MSLFVYGGYAPKVFSRYKLSLSEDHVMPYYMKIIKQEKHYAVYR